MNAKLAFLLCLTFCAHPLFAQGFAGMGQAVEGFAQVDRTNKLVFPQDHGAHPAYRIEWWYLTANLRDEEGQDLGVQWTVFRNATRPADGPQEAWDDGQIWLGHAAVTWADRHVHAERYARGATGQAGADLRENQLRVWMDDWQLQSLDMAPGSDPLAEISLTARGADFAYDLTLAATGPLVLHGEAGFSIKSESAQASYYFSQPFFEVEGTISLTDGVHKVTGHAWLDREWSSQPLAADQSGWDWVSLHFDTGEKLMGFALRSTDGSRFTSATWIEADGTPTAYGNGALRMTPMELHEVAGRSVPVGWNIQLPARGLDITTTALNPDAWMAGSIPYWEGPIRATGSHRAQGYLEMTGY
ncbi:iron ABC transporter permease [Rhodobacteraceae bacterium XHP0102]|nr:iron ABC transporter permease [Rhodobacteraceae bacterium XHP0102]